MARPILVGELNPYGADPRAALWPAPVNSSGWRLCTKILGMSRKDYLITFERKNLCVGVWDYEDARENANAILSAYTAPLILLGAKVCSAFNVAYQPFATQSSLFGSQEMLVLPHPSGRCFAWNDPENSKKARDRVFDLVQRHTLPVEVHRP